MITWVKFFTWLVHNFYMISTQLNMKWSITVINPQFHEDSCTQFYWRVAWVLWFAWKVLWKGWGGGRRLGQWITLCVTFWACGSLTHGAFMCIFTIREWVVWGGAGVSLIAHWLKGLVGWRRSTSSGERLCFHIPSTICGGVCQTEAVPTSVNLSSPRKS